MCICADLLSLPARGAWIEIIIYPIRVYVNRSLPARGAWIEIGNQPKTGLNLYVAPRTGSVD